MTATKNLNAFSNADASMAQKEELVCALFRGFCTIFTYPLEAWLRPFFGTRYTNYVTVLGSNAVMIAAVVFSAAVGHRIGRGLIGIPVFYVLYLVTQVVHAFRLRRRMLNTDLELHSQWEGRELPIFTRIERKVGFWPQRMLVEPGSILAVAALGYLLHLVEGRLALYLAFASIVLASKMMAGWYSSWLKLRILLDGTALAKLYQQWAKGQKVSMPSVLKLPPPETMPPAEREAIVRQVAPEIEAMRAPVRPIDDRPVPLGRTAGD